MASTKAALREMMLPGILTIGFPIAIVLLGKLVYGDNNQLIAEMLGGYMAGVTVSGVLWAVFQNNAGGAWDNAKKYIEAKKLKIEADDINPKKNENNDMDTSSFYDVSGKEFYGKKSKPHKAAVVGDTVGDPLKDTSGPALNILIKLMAILSLIFASKFTEFHPL
mgnify:CR=1 FL=1